MFINVAVCGKAGVAEGAARCCAVGVEHQEVGIVEIRPAVKARVAVTRHAGLARVLTIKLGFQNKIIQLVDDVGLGLISVGLDHKTVTWLVVDGVLNIFEQNCDLSRVQHS